MSAVRASGVAHLPVATLVRTIPVKVLDVSRCGCRLEAGRWLPPGVSGRLSVEIDGRMQVDDVRVARCQQRAGAGPLYQVGAELLRTRRLHRRSVRLAVGRIISDQARGVGHAADMNSDPVPLAAKDQRDERDTTASRAPPETVLVERT